MSRLTVVIFALLLSTVCATSNIFEQMEDDNGVMKLLRSSMCIVHVLSTRLSIDLPDLWKIHETKLKALTEEFAICVKKEHVNDMSSCIIRASMDLQTYLPQIMGTTGLFAYDVNAVLKVVEPLITICGLPFDLESLRRTRDQFNALQA